MSSDASTDLSTAVTVKDLSQTSWGWGRTESEKDEFLAQRSMPWYTLFGIIGGVPAYLIFFLFGFSVSFWSLVFWAIITAAIAMPTFCFALLAYSHYCAMSASTPLDQSHFEFKDKELEKTWKGKKMPVLEFYEAYFDEKIDVKGDVLDILYKRYSFISMVLSFEHIRYFCLKLIPELIVHSKKQDTDQVRDHYDRGNDFYNSFLGETMVYTSGIFHSAEDSLTQSQINKMNLVCEKIHLKKGEKMLDIGCGWGTLTVHAAKKYGAIVDGVTLAKNQKQWADGKIKEADVGERARILCMDYREIPATKYNKITCLEMAEHVGVRLFPKFLAQVREMLEDDGIFYLQIAGLRRPWQFEDLLWGCFMGNYVFPGADASCPLAWVVDQCEGAGFEVRSVETVGIHYSATIKHWYDNWVKNKKYIVKTYGEKWWRKWAWFLGWSVISPEQGSASCYQIVMHKNTRNFDRKMFIAERSQYKI